jgi:hypothetical protein
MSRDAMTVGLSPKNGWVSHIEGHDVARFSTATRHFVALCHPEDIDHYVEKTGRLLISSSYRWAENLAHQPAQDFVCRVDELPSS